MRPSASAKPAGSELLLSQGPMQELGPGILWRFHTEVQRPFPSDSVAVWGGQFDSCLPFFRNAKLSKTDKQTD